MKAQTTTEEERVYDEILAQNPNAVANGQLPTQPDLKLRKTKRVSFKNVQCVLKELLRHWLYDNNI